MDKLAKLKGINEILRSHDLVSLSELKQYQVQVIGITREFFGELQQRQDLNMPARFSLMNQFRKLVQGTFPQLSGLVLLNYLQFFMASNDIYTRNEIFECLSLNWECRRLVSDLFFVLSSKDSSTEIKSMASNVLTLVNIKLEDGFENIVDFLHGAYSKGQWHVLERISKLVLSVPRNMEKVKYYDWLSEKLGKRLRANQERWSSCSDDGYFYLLIRLVEVFGVNALNPSLWPVVGGNESESVHDSLGRRVLTSSEDIEFSIELLSHLLTNFYGSPQFYHKISSVVLKLMPFYAIAISSKSLLAGKITHIFKNFFGKSDSEDIQWLFSSISMYTDSREIVPSEGSLSVVEGSHEVHPIPNQDSLMISLLELLPDHNAEAFCSVSLTMLKEYRSGSAIADLETLIQLLVKRSELFSKYPVVLFDFCLELLADEVEQVKNIRSSDEYESSPLTLICLSLLSNILLDSDGRKALGEMQDASSKLESLKSLIDEIVTASSDFDLPELAEIIQQIRPALSFQILTSSNDSTSPDESKLKDSLEDLNADNDAATHAHGIYTLRSLILKNSIVISRRLEHIQNILLGSLASSDSFVYLNAIKALSALTDIYPHQTIPFLSQIFASTSKSRISSEYKVDDQELVRPSNDSDIIYRLRIGEVILQTVQRLGKALDICYKALLEDCLFKVIGDASSDPDLKASALSIVSVVAETSPLSLRFCINHLVQFCLDCIKLESHLSMRRASLCVLKEILSVFRELELASKEINSILRTVKRIAENPLEQDMIFKFHAEQALINFQSRMEESLSAVSDSENNYLMRKLKIVEE